MAGLLDLEIMLFAAIGFFAQLVDGALGMAFGIIASSSLIATGGNPRHSVGSVNLAEFFVAVTVSVTFLTQLDLARYGKPVIGLIVGGAFAAPLGAYLLRIMPMRVALVLVGLVVAALSIFNIARLFT